MLAFHDTVGLVGLGLIIWCYMRVQWRRDHAKTIEYSATNLAAATLLLLSVNVYWHPIAFLATLYWGLVSLYGIVRCLKYKKYRRMTTEFVRRLKRVAGWI